MNCSYQIKRLKLRKFEKKLMKKFGSSRPEVFLRKGVLKICSKFTGKHPCGSVKSHLGMGVLLEICCIISEHLSLIIPLDGCFWNLKLQIYKRRNMIKMEELTLVTVECTPRKKCPFSELFWFKCGKMRTRITPNTDTFHAVVVLDVLTTLSFRLTCSKRSLQIYNDKMKTSW